MYEQCAHKVSREMETKVQELTSNSLSPFSGLSVLELDNFFKSHNSKQDNLKCTKYSTQNALELADTQILLPFGENSGMGLNTIQEKAHGEHAPPSGSWA